MSKKLFSSLFQYKSWANGELFAALQSVPETAHPQQMHLAARIVSHVLIVDQIFKANLVVEQHTFKAANAEEIPRLSELRAPVRRVDEWYLNYVDSLSEAQLAEPLEFTFTDGSAGRMTREEMLAHVITHGNSHRGQISVLLHALSIPLPRDIFTHFLHRERP